jgi:hypothetical protein
MAGYCSVLHAIEIIGSSGTYGRRLRAAVIGFGATARGVTALNAHGIHDIDILTNRGVTEVASPIHSARIVHFVHDATPAGGSPVSFAFTQEGRVPLAGYLAEHDIIVNCVLQDTNTPLIFLDDDDLAALRPNSLIVDVSCDEAMGSAGRARPRLSGRRSSSARTSPTMRSTTARPTCRIRRPGRSARRCFPTCRRCLPGVTHGRPIRRCTGRSRSSTGLC